MKHYAPGSLDDIYLGRSGEVLETIAGEKVTLQVALHNARYPYPHTVIDAQLVPCDKESAEYRRVKAQLGDDWSIDLFSSFDQECHILAQLEAHNA